MDLSLLAHQALASRADSRYHESRDFHSALPCRNDLPFEPLKMSGELRGA